MSSGVIQRVTTPDGLFPRSSSARTPSIFDVLAEESLLATFRPALRRLLRHCASLDPTRLGWLRRWEDESALALEILAQWQFLSRTGAGLAENFYGMRRQEQGHDTSHTLRRWAIVKSLLVLSVVPYLKTKLESMYKKLKDMDEEGGLPEQYHKSVKAFLSVYPMITTSLQWTSLFYQLLFAFGRSGYHDPLEHLLGLRLELSPPESPQPPPEDSAQSVVKAGLNGLLRMSGRFCSHAFSVGLFFVQFLDVFGVEGEDNNNNRRGLESGLDAHLLKRLRSIPPPDLQRPRRAFERLWSGMDGVHERRSDVDADVTSSQVHVDHDDDLRRWRGDFPKRQGFRERTALPKASPVSFGFPSTNSSAHYSELFSATPCPLNSDDVEWRRPVNNEDDGGEHDASADASLTGLCPVCGRAPRQPTALSVSGFVFCHDCIVERLKRDGLCPVTQIPANSMNLVRLRP